MADDRGDCGGSTSIPLGDRAGAGRVPGRLVIEALTALSTSRPVWRSLAKRTAPPRHQSLRATLVDYDCWPSPNVILRLAVFAPFLLEAASPSRPARNSRRRMLSRSFWPVANRFVLAEVEARLTHTAARHDVRLCVRTLEESGER